MAEYRGCKEEKSKTGHDYVATTTCGSVTAYYFATEGPPRVDIRETRDAKVALQGPGMPLLHTFDAEALGIDDGEEVLGLVFYSGKYEFLLHMSSGDKLVLSLVALTVARKNVAEHYPVDNDPLDTEVQSDSEAASALWTELIHGFRDACSIALFPAPLAAWAGLSSSEKAGAKIIVNRGVASVVAKLT